MLFLWIGLFFVALYFVLFACQKDCKEAPFYTGAPFHILLFLTIVYLFIILVSAPTERYKDKFCFINKKEDLKIELAIIDKAEDMSYNLEHVERVYGVVDKVKKWNRRLKWLQERNQRDWNDVFINDEVMREEEIKIPKKIKKFLEKD